MPVDHRDRSSSRILLALLPVLLWLGGCGAGPQVTTLGARPIVVAGAEGSPDAAGYRIDLEILNPSDEDMPLERIEYTFIVRDVGRFNGRWAAFRTIPPGDSVMLTIPASTALPLELGNRVDLDGDFRWRIEGGVRYQAPGLLGQILFDAGVRRPTEPFSGSGTFRLDRPAEPEPSTGDSSPDDADGPEIGPEASEETDPAS
ncbi:MAG: LEA type 2 family protein [Phycisphaera sp.]|nr:LEA type 2 family protein [Phycisphaera sp.]